MFGCQTGQCQFERPYPRTCSWVPAHGKTLYALAMQSLLEPFAIAAEQAGYRAWVSPADETGRVSELFCLIHVDAAGRNYIVHGFFPDELLETLHQPVDHDSMVLMQLTVALPFTVEVSAGPDTALVLHMLNLLVPHGQFIFSEPEGLIVFRATLSYTDPEIPPALVLETIHMTRFFLMQFAPLIEPVAQGRASYRTVREQLARQGIGIPTVSSKP